MTRTVNTGNALGAKLLFEFAAQENVLPYTDAAGGRTVSAAGDASITLTSPGPAANVGTTGYFTAPSSPIVTAPFTMALFWRMTENRNMTLMSVCRGVSDDNYFQMYIVSLGITARTRVGGSVGDATGFSVGAFNTWYCTAGIFESDGVTLWHEGTMGSKASHSLTPSGSGSKVGIGALAVTTPTDLMAGYAKYVCIFDGALSDAELDSYFADPEQMYSTSGGGSVKRGLMLGIG